MIEKRQQRDFGGCLLVLVLIVLGVFLGWRWIHFAEWSGRLPPELTLAGVPIGGATQEEALDRLMGAYYGPILLYYQDRQLSLSPNQVSFQIDVEGTAADLQARLEASGGLMGFVRYLLGQFPEAENIPVQATYSVPALRSFLSDVAEQYDQPAKPPVPQAATGSYTPGEPGHRLDIDASIPAIEEALMFSGKREARLVVNVQYPPAPNFDLLGQIIENELATFPGIASVFAKDLQTGDEIAINSAVAYAGMSIIKIAIMEEAYRYLDQAPDVDTTKILTETMSLSGNFTANLLLRMIGEGDAYQGVAVFNSSMKQLGLQNTFMATPYDEDVTPPTIVTEANSRSDLDTQPDPYMQTTPADMGLLLEMIYQCSQGGGALAYIYPEQITTQDCGAMIDHMFGNQLSGEDDVPVLIAAGLPEGTPIAHKHGWVADTRGDAALVFTPGGDYVLVIYLYQPGWVDWDQTNAIMSRISRLLYNYFNPPT